MICEDDGHFSILIYFVSLSRIHFFFFCGVFPPGGVDGKIVYMLLVNMLCWRIFVQKKQEKKEKKTSSIFLFTIKTSEEEEQK